MGIHVAIWHNFLRGRNGKLNCWPIWFKMCPVNSWVMLWVIHGAAAEMIVLAWVAIGYQTDFQVGWGTLYCLVCTRHRRFIRPMWCIRNCGYICCIIIYCALYAYPINVSKILYALPSSCKMGNFIMIKQLSSYNLSVFYNNIDLLSHPVFKTTTLNTRCLNNSVPMQLYIYIYIYILYYINISFLNVYVTL